MGRTIVACRTLENYLHKLSNEQNFSFGVIVGQLSIQDRDYIVHLARTPIHVENEENQVSSEELVKADQSINDIDSQLLMNHALSVTRMIPASFYVLGVFVVGESDIFGNSELVKTARNLLQHVHKVLLENKLFCGYPDDTSEILLLSYSSVNSVATCKSYDVKETSGSLKDADWRFIDKPLPWQMFETNYELDEVFPLIKHNKMINIEENFYKSMEAISNQIKNSVIFIQNENVEDGQTVENYVKDQISKKEETESISASIYLPAIISSTDSSSIEKFNGTVRYTGMVYSRIWIHPKATLKDAQIFIRNDILRSLTSRIQMYCDDQNESTASTEDNIVINEPPRRVFFDVPHCDGVQFSEYIFRGETAIVAAEQAKEILDLDIESDSICTDLETLPEYDDDFSIFSQPSLTTGEEKPEGNDASKTMYIIGIVTALLILILSIILHFIFR